MPPDEHVRRAGRPRASRGGLTRERVLAEALVLLDRDGVGCLTMRGLADHLGVTPMALYNHVNDKQDLLQGIAQALLDEADFSSDHPDWRERLRACFRELRRTCLAHPSVVRLMEALDAAPISVFVPMEITLDALNDLGIGEEDALRAYFVLTNFTLGQVSYEIRGPFKALDLRQKLQGRGLRAAGLPRVERASLKPVWDFDRAFEYGLSVIIAGLERHSAE